VVTHLLAAPAEKQPELQARFPHTRVVADAGRAGGIYGALNAALAVAGNDWDWFTYINDDDTLLPGFSEALCEHGQLRGTGAGDLRQRGPDQ